MKMQAGFKSELNTYKSLDNSFNFKHDKTRLGYSRAKFLSNWLNVKRI